MNPPASTRQRLLGLGFLLGTTISVPALAQPVALAYPPCTKTVTTSESELAHEKYIAGRQDYDEGNYDSALRRLRDAYTLDCTKHELLVIISVAYERKGDKKAAVSALEAYVARVPSAPDLGTYQLKIENLKKQIAEARSADTAAPPVDAPSPAAPSGETREHTVLPWIMVAGGGVALGMGIALIATAPELPGGCDEKTRSCPPKAGEEAADFEERKKDAGKAADQPTLGAVVTIGGGALVIGGLVWHFLEPTRRGEPAKARVRPSVAPGYAGLSLGGTF